MNVASVTLITGASSGIGAATARRLAGPGEALFLTARGGGEGEKIAALTAVAEEAAAQGAIVDTMIADLEEAGSGSKLVAAAVDRFGQLDRIVSNAGFAAAGGVTSTPIEAYERSLQVIYRAFLDMIRAAEPHLKSSSAGRIVAVSSFVTTQAPGGRIFPATAAAKGALEALSRTLAVEFAEFGVTVNCVAPGFTQKESHGHSALSNSAWEAAAAMTPNKRLAMPDDIAAAIAFFLSEEAGHVTGQTLRVDGGLSLV